MGKSEKPKSQVYTFPGSGENTFLGATEFFGAGEKFSGQGENVWGWGELLLRAGRNFWGWGGEDDDMAARVQSHGEI